jgi:hypothetical protein
MARLLPGEFVCFNFRVVVPDAQGDMIKLHELMSDASYDRSAQEMRNGLGVIVDAWNV